MVTDNIEALHRLHLFVVVTSAKAIGRIFKELIILEGVLSCVVFYPNDKLVHSTPDLTREAVTLGIIMLILSENISSSAKKAGNIQAHIQS